MRKSKVKLIIVSVLLMLSLLAGFVVLPATAEVTKTAHTHDIAIVFDNSGSMYLDSRWCQAIYAMEVFAAMLDYENDKLGIYPMETVQIGKGGESISERLDISSKDDVKKIEKIYSPEGSETILKPAYDAAKYLEGSDKDEKWLIVLTDGEFFFDKDAQSEKREAKTSEWLSEKLTGFAVESGINVQYLGFAEASSLIADEANNFYATSASSAEALTAELVNICNKIFKRNVVASSGGSFDIDVSMKSIIAFAQGKDAKISSLTAGDGKKIEMTMSTDLGTPREGTGFTEQYPDKYPAPVAEGLSGQVVTFGECPSGKYQLDCSDPNVQIFYEPNVGVKTALLDKDGNEVAFNEKVQPGDYTLQYGLVDAVTGEDVTNSPLLSPVNLTATLNNAGQNQEGVASGTTITLKPDDKTQINVEGTFLNDYHISNAGENGVFEFVVDDPPIEKDALTIKVEVKNFNSGKKWYKLADHEDWKPIYVEVRYHGEKLPPEALTKAVTFKFSPEDKNIPYYVEPLTEESAFNIYIGKDENGEYVEPKTGKYRIDAYATVLDEFDREIKADGHDRFTVSTRDAFWDWLLWVVILAALVMLIITILNLPAWPKKMACEITSPASAEGVYNLRIRNSMTLIPYTYALDCTAKKRSKIINKLTGRRCKIWVNNLSPDRHIESITIGANTYTRANGFNDGEGKPFEGLIVNGTPIRLTFTNRLPLDCNIIVK